MSYDPVPPFRRDFDAARDPYTARNALGITETTGGAPAPVGAEYITASADATLTNERVLTDTATVTWDYSTPGQAKATATLAGGPFQPQDATLTALAAYNTNGLLTQTAADTFTGRTLTGPAAGITVSNGNGVAGDPTLALANDLAALEALSGTNTIYYRSGTDTWSGVTIGTGLTFASGTLSASGSAATISLPQGRLTLQTATPVMTTTQSAKTTIYYTPYVGNLVPIYDGSLFTMTTCNEISVATTDTTKNPAAIGASKVNDWFVWNDSGTMRLTHGPDWTSDTARSAGTALVMVNGIYLNNASITNGPAASRGTYVGTTRSNASSQLNWIYGAAASGGTAGNLAVWNTYNRVDVGTTVTDTGANYTYSSGTIRQARGGTTNVISFVVGLAEDAVLATHTSRGRTTTAAGSATQHGLGLDTTSAFSLLQPVVYTNTAASAIAATSNTGIFNPGIGYHFVSRNEAGDGVNACTFDDTSLDFLAVKLRM